MERNTYGFTIIEVLVAIVVMAIIGSLAYVGYANIQARAKLVQQVAELDRVGRAIQLWSAEHGTTFASSGAGAGGRGVGAFGTTSAQASSYTTVSVEQLLRESGYLQGDTTSLLRLSIMVAPCTTESDSRWVVLAIVKPVPAKPVAEQIAEAGCTNGLLAIYTNSTYGRNLVRVY